MLPHGRYRQKQEFGLLPRLHSKGQFEDIANKLALCTSSNWTPQKTNPCTCSYHPCAHSHAMHNISIRVQICLNRGAIWCTNFSIITFLQCKLIYQLPFWQMKRKLLQQNFQTNSSEVQDCYFFHHSMAIYHAFFFLKWFNRYNPANPAP